MKKPTTKKLALATTTLRQLDCNELATVAGGAGERTNKTCATVIPTFDFCGG